jgi:hypothetical protein
MTYVCPKMLASSSQFALPEQSTMLTHSSPVVEELSPWSAAQDRRAAPRYRVSLTTACRAVDAGPSWPGTVRDLSALGVSFLASRRLELSALLELELCKEGRGVLHATLARVVHIEADVASTWLVGCAFTSELSDAELALFQAGRVRPAAEDSRRWVRFPCNVETVCWTSETVPGEQRPARVVNISPGGIGLLLPCEFLQGTLLRFRMPAAAAQHESELLVRVVRAMQHTTGYWFHGCEFVNRLDDEDLRALLRR